MKQKVIQSILVLLLTGYVPNSFALMLDFQSTAIAALDGLTTGAVTIDGINMEIQAGEFDQDSGSFFVGASDSTLAFVSPGEISSFGGLGVDSMIGSGTNVDIAHGVSRGEGIRLLFDTEIIPENIILPTFGNVGVLVYADSLLADDIRGLHSATLVSTIGYPISSLTFAPNRNYGSSDPVFLLTAISGDINIPEPTTFFILALGIAVMAGVARKRIS